ncbi:MAG: GNAT family N-acetyltransferase [Gammaproteobacteria bacterium]|nr:GNAT family N-acetyltransferase [Gammaproteobacteria bacterium]
MAALAAGELKIIEVDYQNREQGAALLYLLDCYASDPMGGGTPLSAAVRDKLLPALAAMPHAFSLLAYCNHQAVGLVNCFITLSTFSCQPLVNIHDVVVLPAWRGKGVSQLLLSQVEVIARARGCCKLTLEVLKGNAPARSAYRRFGFSEYILDAAMGSADFWEKPLS